VGGSHLLEGLVNIQIARRGLCGSWMELEVGTGRLAWAEDTHAEVAERALSDCPFAAAVNDVVQ
jgi:hypothetical protein